MKKLTIPFFFCLLVLLPISGIAADKKVVTEREKAALLMKTGGDLYTLCSLAPNSGRYDKGLAFCYGFVSGAMSFYGAIADSPKTPNVLCTDHDIPRGVMVDAFLEWAENNQEKMEEFPIDGLVRAAMDRWPCPQKQGENLDANYEVYAECNRNTATGSPFFCIRLQCCPGSSYWSSQFCCHVSGFRT